MALTLISRNAPVETTVPAKTGLQWVGWGALGTGYGLTVTPGTYLATVVAEGATVSRVAVWNNDTYTWTSITQGTPVRLVFPSGFSQLRMQVDAPKGGTVTVKLDKVSPPPPA